MVKKPQKAVKTLELNNGSGLKPFEYKVLVLPDKVDERSSGGLLLPQQTREAMQFGICKGTLVAVSELAFNFDAGITDHPKPGDRVLFAKYAGGEIEGDDGLKYRIMSDKDIMAVCTSSKKAARDAAAEGRAA